MGRMLSAEGRDGTREVRRFVDRIALENGEAGAEVKILRLIEEQYSVNHLGDYKVHIPIST